MKVEIGIHTNAELLQELKEHRVQLNPFALQLFEDQMIQTKQRGQTLSVLVITPSDLGAPFGATLAELVEHAAQRDLRALSARGRTILFTSRYFAHKR